MDFVCNCILVYISICRLILLYKFSLLLCYSFTIPSVFGTYLSFVFSCVCSPAVCFGVEGLSKSSLSIYRDRDKVCRNLTRPNTIFIRCLNFAFEREKKIR
ncbi:hypothetical protein Hanom_Chr11g00969361 [Helianthus anomalus]